MSLRHAILTALTERPSAGAELLRRFDGSIAYFWPATHQQIYRELAKLESDGLIESVPQPPSRGSKKQYRVLPSGREELVSWVSTYEDPRPVRDPLQVRLRAAAAVGMGDIRSHLQRHRDVHQRQLAEYRAIAERDFSEPVTSETTRLQRAVLRAGIGLEEQWVAWIDATLAELADAREE